MRKRVPVFFKSLARMGCLVLVCAGLTAIAWFSPTSAKAQTPVLFESQKLLASDGSAANRFGREVSISGEVAVITAPGDDSGSGAAYVYRHDGVGWLEEQKLLASDRATLPGFGASSAVSGDVALIGGVHFELIFEEPFTFGSAYVYRYGEDGWVEEQRLPPLPLTGYRFGTAVALSGDVAVIGAPIAGGGGGFGIADSAYVYRDDGTGWAEEQRLLASDCGFFCGRTGFGGSVAVTGSVVVIGASGDDSGSAYVYRHDGSGWVGEQKLLASDGAAGDEFGGSVAVSGDVVVIGAFGDDTTGSAYVFRYNGSNWVEEQKLLASDGAAGDEFGGSVAVSGDVVVIGAFGDDTTGSAYVFRYNGSNWVEEQKLLASDGALEDGFGGSVALSGDVALIGAAGDDANGDDSGSAYLYALATTKSVDLDIKPGDETNSLNLFSNGIIPVAMVGSDAFDVADVDGATLAFGPAGAAPDHARGPHFEDVNDDGFTDLIAHFRTQETNIAIDAVEACLTGETLDGVPFEGCDDVWVIHGCGIGFELALLLPPLMWIHRRRRRTSR